MDTECGACVKMNCCNQLEACVGDADCLCVLECTNQGGDPATCHQDCGLVDPNMTFGMFITCAMQQCTLECGG
jgi:hypothetical protein